MGVVRRNFDAQVIFCPLTSLEIAVGRCPSPRSSAIILPNLLNNDSSEVTMAFARTVPVFSSVETKIRCRGPPSLLYNDSWVDACQGHGLFAFLLPLLLIKALREFLGRESASPSFVAPVLLPVPQPFRVPATVLQLSCS
ncbi:hypothetical protein Acr_00g0038230 [Actinidia rufa]|uniref:Uncharacterized protein n=1 Tax=Actinidia rufa TaxID=165716 RepID=A0A7J0DJ08_9ERIC|nr:hypothetical protein Acr_00g0038230 [Actinidia rufa]